MKVAGAPCLKIYLTRIYLFCIYCVNTILGFELKLICGGFIQKFSHQKKTAAPPEKNTQFAMAENVMCLLPFLHTGKEKTGDRWNPRGASRAVWTPGSLEAALAHRLLNSSVTVEGSVWWLSGGRDVAGQRAAAGGEG